MNDERRTPRWLFDRLHAVFDFTVDAAASKENALLPRFWTKEDSGLTKDWSGERVWVNPPYSRGQILPWVNTATFFARSATTVMLLPCDCSTVWFQHTVRGATKIIFVNRRLKFDEEHSGAKFGSVIAIFSFLLPCAPSKLRKLYHDLGQVR